MASPEGSDSEEVLFVRTKCGPNMYGHNGQGQESVKRRRCGRLGEGGTGQRRGWGIPGALNQRSLLSYGEPGSSVASFFDGTKRAIPRIPETGSVHIQPDRAERVRALFPKKTDLRYRATNVAPPPSDPFNPFNPLNPCSPERGSPPRALFPAVTKYFVEASGSRVGRPEAGHGTREGFARSGGLPRSGEHGLNGFKGLNGSFGGGATFVAR